MAITLLQIAKLETDPFKKYVVQNMIRQSKLMEIIPFEDVDSLRSIAIRWQTLPSVAFRAIGGSYTASEGNVEFVWESVYVLGGSIQWDRVYEKVKGLIVDPIQLQVDMKLKSLTCTFLDYFINGSPATDILGFTGLSARVALMPARQTVYFAGASAAALDPTASVANARAFFDALEDVHGYAGDGADILVCNEFLKMGIGRVARYVGASGGSFLDVTKDNFDRQILTYKGAPVVDIGLKKDQSTEIITNSETAGDAGADATSIYGVKFDTQQGISGIQLGELEVYDPFAGGDNGTTPQHQKSFEWVVGLAGFGSYGFTRGRNVEGTAWT